MSILENPLLTEAKKGASMTPTENLLCINHGFDKNKKMFHQMKNWQKAMGRMNKNVANKR